MQTPTMMASPVAFTSQCIPSNTYTTPYTPYKTLSPSDIQKLAAKSPHKHPTPTLVNTVKHSSADHNIPYTPNIKSTLVANLSSEATARNPKNQNTIYNVSTEQSRTPNDCDQCNTDYLNSQPPFNSQSTFDNSQPSTDTKLDSQSIPDSSSQVTLKTAANPSSDPTKKKRVQRHIKMPPDKEEDEDMVMEVEEEEIQVMEEAGNRGSDKRDFSTTGQTLPLVQLAKRSERMTRKSVKMKKSRKSHVLQSCLSTLEKYPLNLTPRCSTSRFNCQRNYGSKQSNATKDCMEWTKATRKQHTMLSDSSQ